jgi:hypothetical protein
MTTSRSTGFGEALLPAFVAATLFLLDFQFMDLQFLQIVVQAIEALHPELAVVLHPIGDVFERSGFEAARTALGIAAARNEAGTLQPL